MHTDDLFTAPQVAKICSTDLKTIHNWVNRGEIKYFRTPGRHLRFRRQDVLEFLHKYGYPVPTGFEPERQKVVVVDRDRTKLEGLKSSLGENLDVDIYHDCFDALMAIGRQKPSMVLINGNAGNEALRIVERIADNISDVKVAVYGTGEELISASRRAGADCITDIDSSAIKTRVLDILGVPA